MTPPDLPTQISQHLDACAHQHGVHIVFAVEAGCRASGTAAPDSGHDVRFVYVHPADSYASPWVEERATVIHAVPTHKLACIGMDVLQLVRALANSNPDVIAWLQSPVVYRQHGPFVREAKALLPDVFCPALAIAQYRQRVWSIRARHLTGEAVWPAAYLTALSALLPAAWVDRHGTPPPLAFDLLLQDAALHPALHAEIHQLLLAKRSGAITALAQPNGMLDSYIGRELQRELPNPLPPVAAARAARSGLERLFQQTLQH